MSKSTPLAAADRPAPSRYVVGIDLGTTNSAVAWVDTEAVAWTVETFRTPQLVAPGVVESRDTLPSFHYEAAVGELPPEALALPWDRNLPLDQPRNYAVGVFARDHGETVPGRLIASAKSWLCHAGVDRTAELLPWHAAPDVTRLSPLEASSRYLAHFRAAWNARFADYPLELQDVVLTLPASFDEVARELTVRAARAAGLPRVVLLEEPQAAFYAWIYRHRDDWQQIVQPGQKILVCDIGGGTSDFTLIRVRSDASGNVQFHRVAVGEHLILGGDNLDLALAHYLERKLVGDGRLEPRQWSVLARSCRNAKETLLGPSPPDALMVNVAGGGRHLIGGGLQVEITADEARQVLVEGFLPRCRLDDKPLARRSGFQEFGLPYAPDPAITRYLARFLSAHRHAGDDLMGAPPAHPSGGLVDPARPELVLFNGGLFESSVLRQRLLDVLGSWFSAPASAEPWQPQVLVNDRLDLAVARGAAYYGMVRRGQGVRIAAGLARTYYVGTATPDGIAPQAVCLLPAGAEEGRDVELLGRRFELRIREPVEFPLYVSSTRLTDPAGMLLSVDQEQMTPLPPIRTVLETAKKGEADVVPVHLHGRLTEIGTLDLWCSEVDGRRKWRLQFDVRTATETDRQAHRPEGEREGFLDAQVVDVCRHVLQNTFGRRAAEGGLRPDSIVKSLENASGMGRRHWPSSLLRQMWQDLMDLEAGRKFGDLYEARWLWLLGFSLRPGYGMALDDWRVAQTWRMLQGKRIHHTPPVRVDWLILWRRISAGLAAGQQQALTEPLVAQSRPLSASLGKKGKLPRKPELGQSGHESAEVWRLLASLELISVATKIELGQALLVLIPRERTPAVRDAMIWAIGRLGARQPMHGPLNSVVPAEAAGQWAQSLIEPGLAGPNTAFALMQLARKTGDRYRDVSQTVCQRVLAWLDGHAAPSHLKQLVAEGGELAENERGQMFGETLPQGLRLAAS